MDEYRKSEGVNFSSFKYFLDCPRLYKWKLENPDPRSDAFILGDLVHTILLEPELVDDKFIFWDENERPDQKHTMAAKENKLWLQMRQTKAEREDKVLVPYTKRNQADRMCDAFFTNQFGIKLYNEAEAFEKAVHWKRHGVKCKGKQDIYHPDYIADIKTTAATSPKEFIHKALYYYRYDLQAAMYTDKDLIQEFYFICLPKAAPYIPFVVGVSKDTLDKARNNFYQALKRLKRCQERNVWEGYTMEIM